MSQPAREPRAPPGAPPGSLKHIGKLRQVGQIAGQLTPVTISDLTAVFFWNAGSGRRDLQSQMHQLAPVWQTTQNVRDRDVARVIEARQPAGEKQGQNAFISFFYFLLTIYKLLVSHCYFPPKIKPPGV